MVFMETEIYRKVAGTIVKPNFIAGDESNDLKYAGYHEKCQKSNNQTGFQLLPGEKIELKVVNYPENSVNL